MNEEDKLYRDLQLHLDEQTIGFPATESGSEIRLLKHFFSPKQAKIAMMLAYKYETLDHIYEGAKGIVSREELECLLDETAARGSIGYRKKEDVKQYRNIPYVFGMDDAVAYNANPELFVAATEYSENPSAWKAFLKTKIPQMRTIPIGQSLTADQHINTYDDIQQIIQTTADPIAVIECACRNNAEQIGEPCKLTSRKETCMVLHDGAINLIDRGDARKISKEEAIKILKRNEGAGMVLHASNAQRPDIICSCCGCCCKILRLYKAVLNSAHYCASNFFSVVDTDLCSGCSICEDNCQLDAISFHEEMKIPLIDLTRCLGCGTCVAFCPDGAMELRRKGAEVVPPQTGEEMLEIIMTNKS